jgi:glycopeptide antibiotics resistance protein
MEKKGTRSAYVLILIIITAFTAYEELHLRRYLSARHLLVPVADCLPNFLAILLLAFGYMVFKKPENNREIGRSIIFLVTGLVLYEFVQLAMPHMVFDVKDILASILGGVFAYGVIYIIRKPR